MPFTPPSTDELVEFIPPSPDELVESSEASPEKPSFAPKGPPTRADLALRQIGADKDEAFAPFVPLGPDIKAETFPGKMLAAPYNVGKGLVEGLESRGGLATIPLGVGGKIAHAVIGGSFGVPAIKQGLQRVYAGTALKDPQEAMEGALQAITGGLITAGGVKGLIPEKAKVVAPETPVDAQPPQTAPVNLEIPGDQIPTEAPPSEQPAGANRTEAGESGAVEPPVTAGGTPQAMAESAIVKPQEQIGSATQSVTEAIPSTIGEAEMGAAGIREIPDTGAGGEKYGVAEGVREERAQAGQVEPVEPGTGLGPEAQVQKWREVVRIDPEAGPRLLAEFEADPQKRISDGLGGITRAHGEALFAGARTIEEQFGTYSPQYKEAYKAASDWDKRIKPIQTAWSEIGRGQQGETDLDTGSFTGLRRERERSGKEFTPQQKVKAERVAADNKSAQTELAKASERLNNRIRQKMVPDPEKAALDAAYKTVREAAARNAEAENKARVADEVRNQAVEQVQKDAVELAQEKSVSVGRDEATRKARAENLERAKEAERNKQLADIERERTKKALDAAEKRESEARIRAAREATRRANDPSIAVWEKANEYLKKNGGFYGFDDIRNKIALDLGISPQRVTSIMAQDAKTKRLADEVWTKQRNARRLKESAKRWLKELDTPGYIKALASVPRGMFNLSVFGHGFVALGTHAPIVAFQPRFWNAYVRNFGKMYKLVFSPTYYESQMQDLVRRPNYEVARRGGLQNDPFQYEEYHTPEIRNLVKGWLGEKNMERLGSISGAGNRGYSVLKVLRQDMFDQMWNRLPDKIKNREGVVEAISDGINHATGVTAKGAHPGFAVALFAPRLEASRVMWLAGDTARASNAIFDWKRVGEGEKQFAINWAKERGWVMGTFASLLAINQGFLSAAGSDQKINGIPESLGGAGVDPLASDFLKFKALGANIGYGGALLTMAKLPARMAYAIAFEGKGSKYVMEDERLSKVIFDYARSQMSPFAGSATDLAVGRDYQERPLPRKLFGAMEQTGAVPKRLQKQGVYDPYGWWEYAGTKLPIPVAEGLREGLKGSGMPDEQVEYWLKAIAITSLMTMTGTRITEDTRDK